MSKRTKQHRVRRQQRPARRDHHRIRSDFKKRPGDYLIARFVSEPWCWKANGEAIQFNRYDHALTLADWMGEQEWWDQASEGNHSYADMYTAGCKMLGDEEITALQFARLVVRLMMHRIQQTTT